MAHTKLHLKTWFLAIFLISQAKSCLAALAFKLQLGESYPTAWLRHQKNNRAMAAQDAPHSAAPSSSIMPTSEVSADGNVGRGSENKGPFVAPVSVNDHGHPMFTKFNVVRRFTSAAINKCAKDNLDPCTSVHIDGLRYYSAVADAGCLHLT